MTDVRVESYSEKAIIVRGDTKTYKDDLKKLGGKWNSTLKGWVFPKTQQRNVEEFFITGTSITNIINKTSVEQKNETKSKEPQVKSDHKETSPIQVLCDQTQVEFEKLNKKLDRVYNLLTRVLEIVEDDEVEL